MKLKRIPALIAAAALLTATALPAFAAENETPDSDNIQWLNAAEADPDGYTDITGFDITYRLDEAGWMGSEEEPFAVNGLMIAKGKCQEEDFTWDNSASLPKFLGPAEDLVAHVTGDGSFVGTMFFTNGVDAGALAVGESATIHYEGTEPLFDADNTCLTAYELFNTKVTIEDVQWIKGEVSATAAEKLTWDPVETEQYMDVPTVENGTDANYINITVPKGEGPYPVIFWIHGGGWSQLDRGSCFITNTMDYLLSQGYAVVSAEYTLSKVQDGVVLESGYPNMIYDLKAAVRYLRANADKYNLDTSFIAAMGESAGAHLAMLMGTTNGKPAYEDLTMGNADQSSDVQLMISYFGPADCVGDPIMAYAILGDGYTNDEAIAVSPYYQITKDAPPLYLTHGENDSTVSVEHSKKMQERATALLGEDNVTAVFYEDAPHANIKVYDSDAAILNVAQFLNDHLAQFRAEQPQTTEAEPAAETEAPTKTETAAPAESKAPIVSAAIVLIAAVAVAGVVVVNKKKKG